MMDKIMDLLPIVSCQEATRLASLALDRQLSWKEMIDLKLHLAVCGLCTQFNRHLHFLRKVLGRYQPQQEQRLSPQVKEQLKQSLKSL